MKKQYEEPILEIIRLNACVIVTSGDTESPDLPDINNNPENDDNFTT